MRLGIDIQKQSAFVEVAPGSHAAIPMPALVMPQSSGVAKFTLDTDTAELELEFVGGEAATIELEDRSSHSGLPVARPVVYLDQLHWISLAQLRFAPERLPEARRRAAEVLEGMASRREIILPLSAAHLVETGPTYGRRRHDLATTMIRLSGGWFMRNPVRVRQDELRASMSGGVKDAKGVFTLRPDHLLIEDVAQGDDNRSTALPLLDRAVARLSTIASIYATLVADEPLDGGQGKRQAAAWASANQEFSNRLRADAIDSAEARHLAGVWFRRDLGHEPTDAAAAVGLSPDAAAAWESTFLNTVVAELPYLGRQREVFFHRLRNADDRWDGNDLNDVNSLCCAAGYADLVVGEKKASEYLRRAAKTLGGGAAIARTLEEAVQMLGSLQQSAA